MLQRRRRVHPGIKHYESCKLPGSFEPANEKRVGALIRVHVTKLPRTRDRFLDFPTLLESPTNLLRSLDNNRVAIRPLLNRL